MEMLWDCVPVVTYISGTRSQQIRSKVFQHQPCLFDTGQHLLLHLVLPISNFIYSFCFWHLLQMTLHSLKGQPHASPSRMQQPSSLFTPQPLEGTATAAGRHNWGLHPVLQAQTSLDLLLVMLLPPCDTWGKSFGP